MKGCYCDGEKNGEAQVLYMVGKELHNATARCNCGNGYEVVDDVKVAKQPQLIDIEKWKGKPHYHTVVVGENQTWYEAVFYAQQAWYDAKNREKQRKKNIEEASGTAQDRSPG